MRLVVHVHVGDEAAWENEPRTSGGQWTEAGNDTPEVGKPFVVYRAGHQNQTLEQRNGGSPGAVAAHVQMMEDWEKPSYGPPPTHVHAHLVTLTKPAGQYERKVAGRNSDPGGSGGVGHASSGPMAGAMSFGPQGAGYTSRHLASVPLSEVYEYLDQKYGAPSYGGTGNMDWHGSGRGEEAIRAVMARHLPKATQDKEWVEAEHPRGQPKNAGEFAEVPAGSKATLSGGGLTTQVHVHGPEPKKSEAPPPKPALAGSSGHPAMISSRFVTAKRSDEHSNETYTQTGLGAMKSDPASFAASMALLKDPKMYPYFRGLHGHPEQIAEQALAQMVANIKFVYQNAPPLTRQFGREWYREENKRAQHVAQQTGLPLASVAGAYAALSPQRDWNMNVFLSEAVIHALTKEQATPWSDAMAATGERIAQTTALKALLARVQGKTLGELSLPAEKAMWVRVWEQSRPPAERYYRLFRPDGKEGDWARNNDGTKATPTWGSIAQIANSIKSVESGGDREIIGEAMGDANKVRSFYNNILDPNSPNGDITSDTHAIGVSFLDAIGGSTAPVMHGLGTSPEAAKHPVGWKAAPSPNKTGVKGLYGLHAEAYRRAAKDLGVLPDEVQSLVWEAKRGLFDHMPAGAKAAIHGTWEAYHRGEIGFEQAQAQVVQQAGGWKEPDWVREPRD